MPDILIRGMEMPESCEECVTKHTFFRQLKCADLPGMRNFGENRLYTDSRNPHCPLHELPPHGDLIDRDSFIAEIKKNDTYQNWLFRKMLEKQPVIVPAERSVEDA